MLRHDGWRTAAFFPPAVFFVDAQKLKAYADTYFNFEYVKFEYLDAERRVDQMLAYFDTVKPPRPFVWVHFFEPHEPYEAHADFPFGASDIDCYDSEIAYVDGAIGRLVADLHRGARARSSSWPPTTARSSTSTAAATTARRSTTSSCTIPLIVTIPGVAPRVVPSPVELIDVTPTVLNLLDIPVPARMRGTDLGPWLATPPAPAARLPPGVRRGRGQAHDRLAQARS